MLTLGRTRNKSKTNTMHYHNKLFMILGHKELTERQIVDT